VPVKSGETARMVILDTRSLQAEVILERDTIGHPQFHPDDSSWLRYAGPYHSRIWVMKRDGSENHLAYERDATRKEWIVHETWRPGSMEILTTNWARGVIGIDVETGAVRKVCSFNAWHPMVDPSGKWMVADTKNPDTGLQIFSVTDGIGEPKALCRTNASNAGDHWNLGYCPYDNGPVDVYAPQHTHPHPNISPDGKLVLFTSDKTGYAQIYEVTLSDELTNG
ncbi:MAG: oligogalacturonate lyase family protein, partial [Verrucomicrobiae bacterium]|nr:oligogalacturonate lyase family protein [Verrucomicrobiae bacterium]